MENLRICTSLLLGNRKATIEEFQKLLQKSVGKIRLPKIQNYCNNLLVQQNLRYRLQTVFFLINLPCRDENAD